MKFLQQNKSGFTLVEILVSMMVISIIMGAVITMAHAMSTSYAMSEHSSKGMAILRNGRVRIVEEISQALAIVPVDDTELAIWTSDKNGDNQICGDELVFLESNEAGDCISLISFNDASFHSTTILAIEDIENGSAKTWLKDNCSEIDCKVIPDCSNIEIGSDNIWPKARFVAVEYTADHQKGLTRFEICASVRSSVENLVSATGELKVSDDD